MRLIVGLTITVLVVGVFVGIIVTVLVDHTSGGGGGPGGDTPTISPTRRPTPPPTHFVRDVYWPAALMTIDGGGAFPPSELRLDTDFSYNLMDQYPKFHWGLFVTVLIRAARTGTDHGNVCRNFIENSGSMIPTLENSICIPGLSICDAPYVDTSLPPKGVVHTFASVTTYFDHTNSTAMMSNILTNAITDVVGVCTFSRLVVAGLTVSEPLTTRRKVNFFQLDVNNMYKKHIRKSVIFPPTFNLCWRTRCHISGKTCRASDGACI